ncbi:MAG: ribosome biogenesis/translation initiation ATPase RLI [Candidatus Bathyarchaeia archaeon]|nr:ribosome biogenesis/translation initiation ATPase RLI [Candidatus Bathyarchaeota archaeon]
MVRVAVLDKDNCKPKDCGLPCIKYCPKVRDKIEAIKIIQNEEKPVIIESLCSGCGICVKKCPFKVISIVNLPEELEEECSHRYGLNMFKLYRLPIPKEGVITGLIGRNGVGKSTALKILSGEIKPNLGRLDKEPSWEEVIRHFRGSTLQVYFEKLSRKKLKIIAKPQYIDKIPKYIKGKVSDVLSKVDEKGILKKLIDELQLRNILDRSLEVLSGGELQRVAIAAALSREADVYIFDEPSSHLDVLQRLKAAKAIRELVNEEKIVLIAEHDLAMLDYLSDQVCILYGEPGVYGIVSHPHGVRVGINIYLNGFIPDENMRFRSEAIRFHVKPPRISIENLEWKIKWGFMKKSLDGFKLEVKPGEIQKGEIVGIIGPNGIGKTTFIKLLAGLEKPDEGEATMQGLTVSYKPQYISINYNGVVFDLLKSVAKEKINDESIQNGLIKPLGLTRLLDREIKNLSGGELQRVAIAACLIKDSQIYLLDEPSAYLDVEERLTVAKLIKRIIEEKGAFAFIVEHDIVSQDALADKLMVFTGEPEKFGIAHTPVPLRDGMNTFLSSVNVTFRRDPETGRPRANKFDSKMDRWQKDKGEYYYI